MRVLITGVAGFIGFHLARRLLTQGVYVVGIDNLNEYYSVQLKYDRLRILQVDHKFTFFRRDIAKKSHMHDIFKDKFDVVVNLAAYAGVRHSLKSPEDYIQSNIVGFANILEYCKKREVDHLVYASSASVYGGNDIPFSTTQRTDNPLTLYGATKKSNEVMANAYSNLYGLPCTGLRFFTAYGEWGRPDLALYIFAKAILEDKPIEVFNNGHMMRSFTYIDDLVEVVVRVIEGSSEGHKIYNVANPTAVPLEHLISLVEGALGKKAKKKYLGMQLGDIKLASADIDDLVADFKFQPSTPIQEGVGRFVEWFKEYYKERGNDGSIEKSVSG